MDSAQGGDMAPIFGDLSQSEELSEIKPPLVAVFCMAEKSARLVDSRPKGSFNNYVDRILPFLTPSPCVDSFYTLSVDKNRHFLTPPLACPRSY